MRCRIGAVTVLIRQPVGDQAVVKRKSPQLSLRAESTLKDGGDNRLAQHIAVA